MSGEGVIPAARPTLYCSFCGKDQHEVASLIAGPHRTTICEECIGLCNDIIAEKAAERAEARPPAFTLEQEARIAELMQREGLMSSETRLVSENGVITGFRTLPDGKPEDGATSGAPTGSSVTLLLETAPTKLSLFGRIFSNVRKGGAA